MPPVRRDDDLGDGDRLEELGVAMTLMGLCFECSLLPYGRVERTREGGPAGSEYKGDERLKNIEPKMVELITNEVCCSSTVIHIVSDCRFGSIIVS